MKKILALVMAFGMTAGSAFGCMAQEFTLETEEPDELEAVLETEEAYEEEEIFAQWNEDAPA